MESDFELWFEEYKNYIQSPNEAIINIDNLTKQRMYKAFQAGYKLKEEEINS